MQGKKKICAIFTTVILFLSGFIYVTRFDVREGLCAEAGTDIEYILNENNLHDYINVSRGFDKYLTIDSNEYIGNAVDKYMRTWRCPKGL